MPARPKTVEQWLVKSMAKDDVRYYLQYIYSDGKYLVSTDGHRLHAQKGTNYAPGYYDANMQPINETAQYPEFTRIIPEDRKGNLFEQVYKDDLLNREVRVNSAGEVINIVSDVWIQKKYLVDALSFFGPSEKLELVYLDGNHSILIKYLDYLAVIMPLRG